MSVKLSSTIKQPIRMTSIFLRNKSGKAMSTLSSIKYCASIVRQHDYENFLATLLMTNSVRSPALVVRAFNVEVARIQDQTSDPKTAAFRLKFWQEALTCIYNNNNIFRDIPANPVAQELFKICNLYKIPRRYLERLISSRNNLMTNKYFHSVDELERYAEDSVSSIYHLFLSIAGIKNIHADHAASHLGKAQGITNLLRSVHVLNKHKMVSLPMDILMKYRLSQENVLRGEDSERMRDAIHDLACRANSHLEKARKIEAPKIVNQMFLPAVAVDKYLENLEKCDFNLFDPNLQRGSAMLPFSLYFHRLRNKY